MNDTPAPPRSIRILLVEDDPASRAFLSAALRCLPATVDEAADVAAAMARAIDGHDLWLFDARLPDGTGADLLASLRASHPDVPAIAHTADDDPGARRALLGAGFADVLVKPLPASNLIATVRRHLAANGAGGPAASVLWDDAAAARALAGNREHVAALRRLFLAELPDTRERLTKAAADSDEAAMEAELHRLRASCGFVGAARLADAVAALHEQPAASARLAHWDAVAEAMLAGDAGKPIDAGDKPPL